MARGTDCGRARPYGRARTTVGAAHRTYGRIADELEGKYLELLSVSNYRASRDTGNDRRVTYPE